MLLQSSRHDRTKSGWIEDVKKMKRNGMESIE